MIVCPEAAVPETVRKAGGWRCLALIGPFDLTATGILVSVLTPLANASVSIFALATFDTDHVLVRSVQLETALAALRAAGHRVE